MRWGQCWGKRLASREQLGDGVAGEYIATACYQGKCCPRDVCSNSRRHPQPRPATAQVWMSPLARLRARGTVTNMTKLTIAHGVPVLRRSGNRLQVGLRPDTSVVLPSSIGELLASCNGTQSAAELVAQHGPIHAGVLPLLMRNGLVLTTEAQPGAQDAVLRAHRMTTEVPDADIRIFGGGRLGTTLALLLAGSGIGHIRVIDARPVTAVDVTPWGADRIDIGVRRDHTCAALLERMHRGSQSHHARPGTRITPALDIIVLDQVADWPWFDAAATQQQVAEDLPHLVVAQGGQTIAVTHVVEPGRTPCLGCHHHALTDVDSDWPELCLQLARRLPIDTAHLGLVLTAARVAATTVSEWLLGVRQPPGASFLSSDGRNQQTPWDLHPTCGCNWDQDN
jgi:hypothetical protein